MANFDVLIPVTMSISVLVEANSREEAIAKAFDEEFYFTLAGNDNVVIVESELHTEVCTGNVFHGVLNAIEVSEYD